MRILLVEDERKTSAYLAKGLEEGGYSVVVAEDGTDGTERAVQGGFDLVILDLMLPKKDGWSVLRELRAKDMQTKVLILTARDAVDDRVRGLEMGADDYLVKPFAFSELLARVRTILRRGPSRSEDTISIADLQVDLVRHRATRNGLRLDLTQKEFALLSLMARRYGEVLTRTFIAEQVWDINFDCGTNVVDVHVRRLRAKMDDPFEKKLIHTVRHAGYVLQDRS